MGRDIWTYNVSSGNWAWMDGNTYSDGFQFGSAPSLSFSSTAYPEGRNCALMFPSSSGNRIRIFGGYSHGNSYSNDFWEYDFTIKSWRTLLSDTGGNIPIYGNFREFSSSNMPGSSYCGMKFYQLRSDDRDQLYYTGGGNEQRISEKFQIISYCRCYCRFITV
jgi:hypothetical protein